MGLLGELKRRNVFRVTAAYLVFAWLLLQVLDVVGPILGLPDVIARYLLFLLVVGIVPAIVIDEAIEIARKYSGGEAAVFVNGILDAVRKNTGRAGPSAKKKAGEGNHEQEAGRQTRKSRSPGSR